MAQQIEQYPTDVWINVRAPEDETREMAMMELSSAQTADILQAYGYYLLMMPRPVRHRADVRSAASVVTGFGCCGHGVCGIPATPVCPMMVMT